MGIQPEPTLALDVTCRRSHGTRPITGRNTTAITPALAINYVHWDRIERIR